jgi:replicative DNA helicase
MSTNEKNFGHLGSSFQQALIKSIIEDKKYGENIIDVIESKYFDNNSFKYIMENMKELYLTYRKIPDYNTLAQKVMSENTNKESGKIHIDTLENIKDSLHDTEFVKDVALNFCKQQNLRKELKLVNNIIENGDFEEYSKIEHIIQKALQVGVTADEAIDVFHDIQGALKKDYRQGIPTGIVGVDNLLKGGLGFGELGVVLAPTGTGKTTLLTKFANTAFNNNFNVLQIVFEDNVDNIRRKHFTIWSGVSADDQPDREQEVTDKIMEANQRSTSFLKIIKLPSAGTTVSEIKSKIRKMKSDNLSIDLLIIDYVDCISPERSNGVGGEEWKGDGNIMRHLESMTDEFNIAIWVATQGNRESISSEIVTTNQMGGSIKKAQIGHVILSVGKTLEQKEHNLGTLTLLKSRIGKDGVIWQNCTFNNEYLIIDTDSQNTLLGVEEKKVENEKSRAAAAFLKRQEIKPIN